MTRLTICSSSGEVEVATEKGRRLLLVVVGLLRQIEAIDRGKVTLSWGERSGIKWTVEPHGEDGTGITP